MTRFTNYLLVVAFALVCYLEGPRCYQRFFYSAAPRQLLIAGTDVSLPGLVRKGEATLVIGISPQCPTCKAEAARGVFRELLATPKVLDGSIKPVVVIAPKLPGWSWAVNRKEAEKWVADGGMAVARLVTPATMASYPFQRIPSVLLVDAGSKVVGVFHGNEPALLNLLK
jgi:hypothetical protein